MSVPTQLLKFYVDGGCRGNGRLNPVAAAACCLVGTTRYFYKTQRLPSIPTPTNSRAEFYSIILALQWALNKYKKIQKPRPLLDVQIYSDSQFAVTAMNEWIEKWIAKGWRNSTRKEPANRDLVEMAMALQAEIKEYGSVSFNWIARDENTIAHNACEKALDVEKELQRGWILMKSATSCKSSPRSVSGQPVGPVKYVASAGLVGLPRSSRPTLATPKPDHWLVERPVYGS